MKELYDPDNDKCLKTGEPVGYYDFEFEQYTINQEILRELLIDEIILTNSSDARKLNNEFKTKFPRGVLEIIYERQEKEKKEESKKE